MRITRTIESDRSVDGSIITFTIEDDLIEITVTDKTYTYATIRQERKEFLDLVVACWPENVAYQFKDNE